MLRVKTIYNFKEVQPNDIIVILTAEEYYDLGEEVTDIIEQFSGEALTVTSVDLTPNEFGEGSVMAQYHDGTLVSFTEHEIHTILRITE